jgi:membrane protein implicated in regulation of membrane protease activity
LKRYGWIWLIVAIILFLSGLGVFTGNQLARWIGVVAGGILAISSIWWMPYYPIWSLTYVILGALVVYGLIAYGSRDEELAV